MNPLPWPLEDSRNKDFTTIHKAKCDIIIYFIICCGVFYLAHGLISASSSGVLKRKAAFPASVNAAAAAAFAELVLSHLHRVQQ